MRLSQRYLRHDRMDFRPRHIHQPGDAHPAAIEAVRMEYDSFYHAILALRQQLKNNGNLTLTAEDYAIGIHIDKTTRTRPPVPNIAPINTLLDTRHLVNQISSAMPVQGDENHRALPEKVQRIGRAVALVQDDSTPMHDQYHAIDSIGATVYDLVAMPGDEHKMCWLITWYINSRGETGPESEPLAFRVI